MYFYNLIKDLTKDKETVIFVDMDGVIAAFDFGKPLEFDKKRPLYTNIKTLEKINELPNVELKILSACRTDNQIEEKNVWLDKYAPFFVKENRNILSRESHGNQPSNETKCDFLSSLDDNRQIVIIDDDILVLRTVHGKLKNIICFQDSELID